MDERSIYAPGLLKREVVLRDRDKVCVRELWDVTAPGCPIIAFDAGVEIVENRTWMSRREWDEIVRA